MKTMDSFARLAAWAAEGQARAKVASIHCARVASQMLGKIKAAPMTW